jgi:transcription-repair coupling factor (superfamily II helicase)
VRALDESPGVRAPDKSPGVRAPDEKRATPTPIVVSGAVGALPGAILAQLSESRPIIVVTADETAASAIAADAEAFGATLACVAPEPSLTPYQRVGPSLKYRKSEFALLSALSEGTCRIAAIPARFLFARLPSPDSFSGRRRPIERGGTIERGALLAFLVREGYAPSDLVTETGDFAARGGIIDVFPADSPRPFRIELDGDEVASIRSFDPDTQRSDARFERIVLGPLAAAAESEEADFLLEERLGRAPSSAEKMLFLPAISGNDATIFDHAPEAFVAVAEPAAVEETIARWTERLAADYEPERDRISPEEALHAPARLRDELARRATLVFDRLGLAPGRRAPLSGEEIPAFDGRVAEAAAEIRAAAARGDAVAVAVHPRGGAEKIHRFAREYALELPALAGSISAGFRLRGSGTVLYSEEQIFGPERSAPAARRRAAEAFLSDLRDLKPGDFVVHADYGVGRFRALRRIPVDGLEREFVEVVYVDDKTLLLPVERLDLIQKYAGAEGGDPKVDRLGSASWGRKKAAAKKAVQDLSEDLLRIYARRAQAVGFAFSKDSPWQKEFEDAFEHVETPDQAQAITDVKRDMERPSPMDRLLCGDVGYGKTEVAMRAAFKAVLDGKQVALLAPTTILADQHYRTFTRRFAAFPVAIELLSRFRDRAEQKGIAARAAEGTVDILIATHRLLSKDIRFRDLGLLIVDEEQRFGVAQKERIKEWKASIDILSMSATPIPRSLNLSLSGLRDLSIIETPPRNRLAIETQIIPRNADLVREAVAFELERGGQVFYVHNRVESILAEKTFLSELLPKARVVIGHGQMSEGELEKTMIDFVARKFDILLATTIIENGIDIPSVNTILIDRADTFGLSQLYQLRGRVGRSDKAAYCYLVVEPDAALTDTARQRLATIREFCDLGAGFRIAAKDLEIRGAGNFLGAEQSGHIAAVGLEMYLDLLEEAMRSLQGGEVPADRPVTISLGLDLSIPSSYLPEESLRMALYKRIARARDDAELAEIGREVGDRFGPPPPAIEHLVAYGRLRRRAERLAIKSIEKKASGYRVAFDAESRIEPGRLLAMLRTLAGASASPTGVVSLPSDWTIERLVDFLDAVIARQAA